jgi:hypothetical protein
MCVMGIGRTKCTLTKLYTTENIFFIMWQLYICFFVMRQFLVVFKSINKFYNCEKISLCEKGCPKYIINDLWMLYVFTFWWTLGTHNFTFWLVRCENHCHNAHVLTSGFFPSRICVINMMLNLFTRVPTNSSCSYTIQSFIMK